MTSITQGTTSVTYQYNGANELIRENNGFTNQTVTYTYDTWGNITEKKIYAYTTATNPGTPTSTIPYVYGNSSWKDQLTKYNGQTISYDAMGNPTTYRGKTLTWKGKELTGVTGTASYTYDMNGLRTAKTVSGTTTNYFYNNTVLMGLTSGSNKLLFSYDAKGLVQAVNFNGTYYYYLRNGQGDIVKIIDGTGAAKVEYSYDSWGKKLSCTGTLATTLGKLNPFRYRGYVYDEETQWYYLKSRYYDPETCRFISADVLLSTGQGVLGYNCFAYCRNNPVYGLDSSGLKMIPVDIENVGKGKTKREPIDDQHNIPYSNLPFGYFGNLDNNGCLIYAIYNAVCSEGYSFRTVYDYVMKKNPAILGVGCFGGDPLRMNAFIEPFGTATRLTDSDDFSGYDAVIILVIYTTNIPYYDGSMWGISSRPSIAGAHYYAGISNGDGLFAFYNGSNYNKRTNSVRNEINQLESDELLLGIWGIKLK